MRVGETRATKDQLGSFYPFLSLLLLLPCHWGNLKCIGGHAGKLLFVLCSDFEERPMRNEKYWSNVLHRVFG